MRASRSPFDWFRSRSGRERRFLAAGAIASAAALAISLVVAPLAVRWSAREAADAANRGRLSRLQALVAGEGNLRRTLDQSRRTQRAVLDLLLPGVTPALAASNLQASLQRYAEESMVQLNRVDVAGQANEETPGLLAMPVLLQGQGDIYALVDFLFRIQHGQRLLIVEELSVNTRSSYLREDQPLVWSLRARGLYPTPAGGK